MEKKCKTIAIVNQKGGVGKSTTTMNLAAALCAMQKKILVIDLDPQSNTTSGLGANVSPQKGSAYTVLIEQTKIINSITPTSIPNLSLLATDINLSGAEIELSLVKEKEYKLKHAINEVEHLFDYILVDCPPSLGLLTINALVAVNEAIIPLQCEYFALEGLSHLVKTIGKINQSLNKNLTIKGILLTMFDKRNNLSKMVAQDVKKHYPNELYKTIIPRNVKVSEAPSHGYPVIIYDPYCLGSKAYINLATEIIKQDKEFNNE